MSFKSVLSTIGKDVKGVFAFLGSSKGQAIIATGESLVEAVYPPLTSVINLANTWMVEIVKDEALAAAAGQQDGTGAQKAAAVISTVTPAALAFAQTNGLPAPTAVQLEAANTALVAFLNAFGAGAAIAATPAAPVAA